MTPAHDSEIRVHSDDGLWGQGNGTSRICSTQRHGIALGVLQRARQSLTCPGSRRLSTSPCVSAYLGGGVRKHKGCTSVRNGRGEHARETHHTTQPGHGTHYPARHDMHTTSISLTPRRTFCLNAEEEGGGKVSRAARSLHTPTGQTLQTVGPPRVVGTRPCGGVVNTRDAHCVATGTAIQHW